MARGHPEQTRVTGQRPFDLDGLDPSARALVELVLRIADGDFAARAEVFGAGDAFDALAVTLNMLAESFQREHAARSQAEGLLADAADSYELAPDAFCSCEPGSLRVTKCNPALARALGVPTAEILGRSLFEFVETQAQPALEAIVQSLPCPNSATGRDIEFLGARGPFIARVTGAVKQDADGSPLRMLLSLRNETESRQLEHELAHAQRLDALARLAGSVAHDFNNLLLVIRTSVEALAARSAIGSPEREELEIVLDASHRGSALVGDLLSFARKGTAASKELVFDELIAHLDPILSRLLGPGLTMKLDLGAAGVKTSIAEAELSRALTNLVANARDAMSLGGELRIQTRVRSIASGELVERPELPPGEYVELSVIDSGPGIPAEIRARIFEPFFTTKATGRGTGLGLSIVYGVVRQAQGHVSVKVAPEGGSVFELLFPVAGRISKVALERAPRTGPQQVLLVIEDDRLVRTLTARVLRGAGYQVVEASEAEEALLLMETRGHEVALVVSDVVMPGMDGVEVLETMRRLRAELPCLFVTGFTKDEERIEILPNTSLLYKPYVPSALLAKVRGLLGENRARSLGTEANLLARPEER